MIKANELRIGNWISLSVNQNIQHYGKVLSIGSEDQQFEQIYCECEESFEWAFKDNYWGIPLDATWLERAGFTQLPNFTVNNAWNIQLGRNMVLSVACVGTPNEMVFINEEEPPVIKNIIVARNYDYDGKTYLHQLQNLYFAITGDELTFKPAPAGSGE